LVGDTVCAVSEPNHVVRQQPRGTSPEPADPTLIVRPAGRPWDIRVFTDVQCAEAETYAAENDSVVESLPFPYPDS
jgi:hypothetical protein